MLDAVINMFDCIQCLILEGIFARQIYDAYETHD